MRRNIEKYKKTREALEHEKAEVEQDIQNVGSIFSKSRKSDLERIKRELDFNIPRFLAEFDR